MTVFQYLPRFGRLGDSGGVAPHAAQESTSRHLFFLKPRSGAMVRQGVFTIVLGVGVLGISLFTRSPAYAELPAGTSLADAARRAAGNFQPIAAQGWARAKADVASASCRRDAFRRTAESDTSAGWKRYLQWNDLVGAVQSDQPQATETLHTVLGKLRANHGGLERTEFTRLRDALARYL